MNTEFTRVALLIILVVASGCRRAELPERAAKLLQEADTLEVLSLDPGEDFEHPNKANSFHGWSVLGKTSIADADRQSFLDAVANGARRPGWRSADCFDPRHGIHASSKAGTVDFVICFECGKAQVYYSKGQRGSFVPNRELYGPLTKRLIKAGIPVAPTMSERMQKR